MLLEWTDDQAPHGQHLEHLVPLLSFTAIAAAFRLRQTLFPSESRCLARAVVPFSALHRGLHDNGVCQGVRTTAAIVLLMNIPCAMIVL